MLASLVQGPLLRLGLVGLVFLGVQNTLLTELKPFDVVIQIVLALAVAAGAGSGPQKGALAGFVLGLLFDLGVGTPLGSSSLTFGLGGYVAGYVTSITIDPQWWLAALFTGLGAAVGEAAVPTVRAFIGEDHAFTPRLFTVVPVVAVAAAVMSPALVPIGRWCMRVKRPEWKAPIDRVGGE